MFIEFLEDQKKNTLNRDPCFPRKKGQMQNFNTASKTGYLLSAVQIFSLRNKRTMGTFAKPTVFKIEKERAGFIFPCITNICTCQFPEVLTQLPARAVLPLSDIIRQQGFLDE